MQTHVPPVFKVRLSAGGGHTTATFFVAPHPDQTYANIGHLTARRDEIARLMDFLPPSTIVEGPR